MSLRVLSRDFAFYGVLDFVQRSLGVLLVPIYTRVLSQANYGNLDLILVVCSAIAVLIDLQFVAGFTRLYLERRRVGEGARLVGTSILTRVALGGLFAAVFLSLGFSGLLEVKFLPSFLANNVAWTLAIVSVPVGFAFDIFLVQAQMLRRKKSFLAGALGNTALLTLLSVLFTVVVPLGIAGVLLGQLIAKILATAFLWIGLRDEVVFQVIRPLFKDLSEYSLPLVPGRWMAHFSGYMSRFFVYGGLGAAENAILAITTKLAAVIGLFSVAFRTAWQPLAMSYIGDTIGEAFYVRSTRVLMAGGIFSIFALTIAARPALAILAPASYAAAEYYLPFFLVDGILAELELNFQLGNQIAKKTYWISIAAGAAFVVSLVLLMTLTTRIGIYGAGIAVVSSTIVRIAITYFSSRHNYRIPYDRRAFAVFGFACASLLLLSFARSRGAVANPVFFSLATIGALLLPLLTFAASERQLIGMELASLFARVLNGRSPHRS